MFLILDCVFLVAPLHWNKYAISKATGLHLEREIEKQMDYIAAFLEHLTEEMISDQSPVNH
jgi:hypothetical protein